MRSVLALDQGTTSSRSILFDERGAIISMAQREHEQIYPRPGWVEHDPAAIWATQLATLREVTADAPDVAAIGLTNQRETAVLWDRRSGEPVANAIVWQDRRTAPMMEVLKEQGHEALIRRKTGLLLDAYFSAGKVAWLLDNVPGLRARAEAGDIAFGTIDSWLAWNLTAGRLHITDPSNASRTMLYDIQAGGWDDELLALFDLPRGLLPEVRPSSAVYGEVASGLPLAGTPIAGIAGDQQAALMGQLCTRPGQAKNTFGTGCFLLVNTGTEPVESRNRLLTTVALGLGETLTYALEGSVFSAGAVVQWLRDGLGLISSASEVERLALSVEDNGGVYLVPAFAGLGAPHWDPWARGTVCGITGGTRAAHLARAALESIAFQVADLADAMQRDAGLALSELRVDGGAATNDTLMQLQADLMQTSVERPVVTETTALGAAYLAGLAVGVWRGPEALESQRRVERRFEPAMVPARAAELRDRWNEAVRRAKGWEPTE